MKQQKMPPKKRSKHIIYGALTLYIVVTIWVAVLFAQKFETLKPDDLLSQGTVLDYSQIVKQGEQIYIKRKPAQDTKGCIVYTERFLAPLGKPDLETLASEELVTFEKSEQEVEFKWKIPDTIAPGDYIYWSRVSYYCSITEKLFGPKIYDNKKVIIKIVPK